VWYRLSPDRSPGPLHPDANGRTAREPPALHSTRRAGGARDATPLYRTVVQSPLTQGHVNGPAGARGPLQSPRDRRRTVGCYARAPTAPAGPRCYPLRSDTPHHVARDRNGTGKQYTQTAPSARAGQPENRQGRRRHAATSRLTKRAPPRSARTPSYALDHRDVVHAAAIRPARRTPTGGHAGRRYHIDPTGAHAPPRRPRRHPRDAMPRPDPTLDAQPPKVATFARSIAAHSAASAHPSPRPHANSSGRFDDAVGSCV
jgi:hypothetical protein